jgi:hypothetical protein
MAPGPGLYYYHYCRGGGMGLAGVAFYAVDEGRPELYGTAPVAEGPDATP